MARIRSIKPDFFTSEVVTSLPLSARLTFIGLWTYADDNGVAPDNDRLITAALWPLEEDPRETLQRTREDLARLSTAGLIVRYEVSGKRLLFVRNWDEHQKVSHPGKPRYPRPTAAELTSTNTVSQESLPQSSGDSPETLRPEQGAGSREQGREQGTGNAQAALALSALEGEVLEGELIEQPVLVEPSPQLVPNGTKPAPKKGARRVSDDDPDFAKFWAAYPRREAKGAAKAAWVKATQSADPLVLIAATEGYAGFCTRNRTEARFIKQPATWLNQECWKDERPVASAAPAGYRPYRNPEDPSVYEEAL